MTHIVRAVTAYVIDGVRMRSVEKIATGRSTYASILNADEKFVDDGNFFHIAVKSRLVVNGIDQLKAR
ncbi:MAG: hypothetical protein R8G34_01560 [Paracoccaceae bacterium]|nr:hypothetical protein [Paracoccaceae bacterium]